jgi:hypothetical protein
MRRFHDILEFARGSTAPPSGVGFAITPLRVLLANATWILLRSSAPLAVARGIAWRIFAVAVSLVV